MAMSMSMSMSLKIKSKSKPRFLVLSTSLSLCFVLSVVSLLPLPSAAVWYSEICQAGPRYKVRIDEATGKLVPVYPQALMHHNNQYDNGHPNDNQQDDQQDNENDHSHIVVDDPDQFVQENGGMDSNGVFYDRQSDPFSTNIRDEDEPENEHENEHENDDEHDDENNAENDNTNNYSSNIETDNESSDTETDNFRVPVGRDRRTLRSKRLWRDFGEDPRMTETDAMVVDVHQDNTILNRNSKANTMDMDKDMDIANQFFAAMDTDMGTGTNDDMNPAETIPVTEIEADGEWVEADPSIAESFFQRFFGSSSSSSSTNANTNGRRALHHSILGMDEEELQPGEFYVKPCFCQDSRWTFAKEDDAIPKTVYNNATDTLIQLPPTGNDAVMAKDTTTDGTGSSSSTTTPVSSPPLDQTGQFFVDNPHKFGLLPNGGYAYVQDGTPDADLYLCNVQAMYCGVLIEMEEEDETGSTPNNSNSNNNHQHYAHHHRRPVVVKCYTQNMRHIIARNAWPLILLWYLGLAIICCCTVHGRTAGDYFLDRLLFFVKKFVCCFWEVSWDFNDRMLNRMIRDDERERTRRRRGWRSNNNNNNDDDDEDEDDPPRPWCYSNQRRQFERSLMAQVQWIWRHQEYLREIALREQGLPPPQLKLKVKRFRSLPMATGTTAATATTTTTTTDENDEEDHDDGSTSATTTTTTTTTTTNATKTDGSNHSNKRSFFGRRRSSERTSPLDNGESTRSNSSSSNDNDKTKNSIGASQQQEQQPEAEAEEEDQQDPLPATPEHSSPPSSQNPLVDEDTACCAICPDDADEFVTLDLGNDCTPEEDMDLSSTKKTKDGDDEIVNDDEDDVDSLELPTCTICFCPFEEGDRIGDLRCKHEFHVDCLKGWVQRKNSCPLCNLPLGTPERPLPPSFQENHHDSSIDGSRHSLSSLLQRLNSLRRGTTTATANENNEDEDTAAGGGEIQMGSRVGMIGAFSAAADINSVARGLQRSSVHRSSVGVNRNNGL